MCLVDYSNNTINKNDNFNAHKYTSMINLGSQLNIILENLLHLTIKNFIQMNISNYNFLYYSYNKLSFCTGNLSLFFANYQSNN